MKGRLRRLAGGPPALPVLRDLFGNAMKFGMWKVCFQSRTAVPAVGDRRDAYPTLLWRTRQRFPGYSPPQRIASPIEDERAASPPGRRAACAPSLARSLWQRNEVWYVEGLFSEQDSRPGCRGQAGRLSYTALADSATLPGVQPSATHSVTH